MLVWKLQNSQCGYWRLGLAFLHHKNELTRGQAYLPDITSRAEEQT